MFTVPPRNNNESENNTKYDNVLLTKNTLSPDLRSLIKERFSFVNDHVLVELMIRLRHIMIRKIGYLSYNRNFIWDYHSRSR